jgi:beta-galactosidase
VHVKNEAARLLGKVTRTPPNYQDRIHYTSDGSTPSSASPVYTKPLTVTLPTTVKALVLRDGRPLFEMEETFAADEGLYWQKEAEQAVVSTESGMQAESAKLSGSAKISTVGKGFQGNGYVDLPGSNCSVLWYQENDGSGGTFTLTFRYANGDPRGVRQADLIINGKQHKTLSFRNTGSWHSDWETLTVKVHLQAGANEISLKSLGRGGPNIDALEVE